VCTHAHLTAGREKFAQVIEFIEAMQVGARVERACGGTSHVHAHSRTTSSPRPAAYSRARSSGTTLWSSSACIVWCVDVYVVHTLIICAHARAQLQRLCARARASRRRRAGACCECDREVCCVLILMHKHTHLPPPPAQYGVLVRIDERTPLAGATDKRVLMLDEGDAPA
jgi:hypothetical protein